MKNARCALKFVALALSVAAVVCVAISNWDKIVELVQTIADKIEERRCAACDVEFEDYADCDL